MERRHFAGATTKVAVRAKARQIEEFLEYLDISRFSEWGIVALFYQSLHLFDAWLAQEFSIHPMSHPRRNAFMAERLPDTAIQYRVLYDYSRAARYEVEFFL